MLQIHTLTPESFKPYGEVFENNPQGPEPFQVQFQEKNSPGWQVAINRVRDGATNKMHRHLDTHECFCPMSGKTVIIVAMPSEPDRVKAFLLDKPVKMNAGIWHTSLTLSGESLVFICENAELQSEDRTVREMLSAG